MKTPSSLKLLLIGTTFKTVVCAQRQLEASEQPSSTGTNFHPSLSHCPYTERSCNVYLQIQIQTEYNEEYVSYGEKYNPILSYTRLQDIWTLSNSLYLSFDEAVVRSHLR